MKANKRQALIQSIREKNPQLFIGFAIEGLFMLHRSVEIRISELEKNKKALERTLEILENGGGDTR